NRERTVGVSLAKVMYVIIIVAFLDTFIQLAMITPYALEVGPSYTLTGSIVAVYSFTNMIGKLISAHGFDNVGRTTTLFTGMISVCIILFLYPLAQTGLQLFIARFFHGLAGGILIPAAFAYVGDQTSGKTRGKAMAFTGASIGIAAIVGPAVGGVLAAKASIETVFVSVAILFLISSLVILFLIKESFHNSDRGRFNIKDFVPIIKHPLIIL